VGDAEGEVCYLDHNNFINRLIIDSVMRNKMKKQHRYLTLQTDAN
jgi:hypothetical protein